MASNGDGAAKRTKVVRLRDPYAAAAENVQLPNVSKDEASNSNSYKALQVIGEIKEKGFSSSTDSKRVSLPQVTVLPFPVARHRSEGPHWTPLPVHSTLEEKNTEEENGTDLDAAAAAAAASARPLIRKKKPGLQFPKYKELLAQEQQVPNTSKHEIVTSEEPRKDAIAEVVSDEAAEKNRVVEAAEMNSVVKAAEKNKLARTKTDEDHMDFTCEERVVVEDELKSVSTSDQSKNRDNILPPTSGYNMKMERSSEKTARTVPKTSEWQAIHEENRQMIAAMSPSEIAETQQELLGRLSPEVLAMFRKRGAQKEAKRMEASIPMQTDEPSPLAEPMEVDEARPADKKDGTSFWSDRVEAVKLMKFDFHGRILHGTENEALADFVGVAERDLLRSEGDPAAYGYTIKEATELTRSTISGQRTIALQIITSVLHNAGNGLVVSEKRTEADWQAVWTYALGPHPELALALRMALDDTYATVLTMCPKALLALLSCSQNDHYFSLRERLWPGEPLFYTAPVFRKQVTLDDGFLGGGSWKYNVKPNELLFKIDKEDKDGTIGDDAAVAERDAAAGLLRTGILPRIRYILEIEKLTSADESLLSILVALGRHSPTSASAVMRCPRLIETIIQRFLLEESSSIIRAKTLQLLKVLSQSSKSNCVYLANSGALQIALGDLFKWSFQSAKAGSDVFNASTVAEAVRLWNVCVRHDVGLALFSDVYAALCNWLSPPSLSEVLNGSVKTEVYALAQESFIGMELLARKLPLLGQQNEHSLSEESWSWSAAVPLVQLSIDWLQQWTLSAVTQELKTSHKSPQFQVNGSFTGTLAAILHFLSTVCERVYKGETVRSIWLPEFVPQVGLSFVGSRLLSFSVEVSGGASSYFPQTDNLVSLVLNLEESTLSVPLASCILGTIRLASALDKLISWARGGVTGIQDTEERILHRGLLKSAEQELQALSTFGREQVSLNSQTLQLAEFKDRGGPAPGVGIGWGAVGGGFWSRKLLVIQTYARVVLELEATFPAAGIAERLEEMIGVSMAIATVSVDCLMVRQAVEEVLLSKASWPVIVQSALRTLGELQDRRNSHRVPISVADAETMRLFLIQHYFGVWLSRKSKKVTTEKEQPESGTLPTIDELGDGGEAEEEVTEVMKDLAGTRLPMPSHWFLSPLHHTSEDSAEAKTIIQAGLLLLLCLEGLQDAGSAFAAVRTSRKVHALSMVFVAGDLFLEKDISDLVEVLQDLYAARLEEQRPALNFQADVNSNYSVFVDKLAVHFASTSYGDLNFGRQIAFYFRQEVAFPLRQTVWRVLAEAKALELLPKLEDCPGSSAAYLYPAEKEVEALEMYLGSWTSGGLDRAFSRKSLSFQMAVHHLAEFLFKKDGEELLRKKFARNIIRTSKRNQQAKEMLETLVNYFSELADRNTAFLVEACEQDSSMLNSLRLAASGRVI